MDFCIHISLQYLSDVWKQSSFCWYQKQSWNTAFIAVLLDWELTYGIFTLLPGIRWPTCLCLCASIDGSSVRLRAIVLSPFLQLLYPSFAFYITMFTQTRTELHRPSSKTSTCDTGIRGWNPNCMQMSLKHMHAHALERERETLHVCICCVGARQCFGEKLKQLLL